MSTSGSFATELDEWGRLAGPAPLMAVTAPLRPDC